MKKLIGLISLICVCAVLLCSCSLPFPSDRYLSPQLTEPNAYYIVYESVNTDGSTHIYAQGRDINGNYYYRDGDTEYLYQYNSESSSLFCYNRYIKDDDRGFFLDATDVDAAAPFGMTMIYMYAKYNLKSHYCTQKTNKNETFAGRNCKSYTIVIHDKGGKSYTEKYTYEVLIDAETGFCLKSQCTALDSPVSTKDNYIFPYGFACTEFVIDPPDFVQQYLKTPG